MAGEVVPSFAGFRINRVAQFFDENRIGTAQQVGVVFFHFAQNPNAQTWSRERMSVYHFVRQSQGDTEFAHFVFEQFTQWLQQFQVHIIRQTADVVVRFDVVRAFFRTVFTACGFDHVGVNRALRQPFGAGEFVRFSVEYFDEFLTDDFALGFGVGHACKFAHEIVHRIDANHFDAQMVGKHIHHHIAFVQAQQTVINEYAGELVANCAVNQRGSDGGVHAAG